MEWVSQRLNWVSQSLNWVLQRLNGGLQRLDCVSLSMDGRARFLVCLGRSVGGSK